jgi:hypothetical protein
MSNYEGAPVMEQDQVQERIHGLEVAQATQAATMAGAEATQAAAMAGAQAAQAAAHAGTWSTMVAGSAGFVVGIFLGMAIAATRK